MKIGDRVIVVDKGGLDELRNGKILKIKKFGTWKDFSTYGFGGYFVLQETLKSPNGVFKVAPISPAIQIMFGVSNEN